MSRLLSHNILYAVAVILWGLLILGACAGGEHQKMLAHLEELERQNLADSVMTNDSLAERLAKYFDHHGTPNERMRAHYILGRTYADMGEASAAVNAYLDAADAADTIAKDCDYHTLSRVYGQMGYLLYSQNLPDDCIRSTRRSILCTSLRIIVKRKMQMSKVENLLTNAPPVNANALPVNANAFSGKVVRVCGNSGSISSTK